jgi:hypothetical protein
MKTVAVAYGFSSGLHVGNIFPAAVKVVKPADYGFAAGLLNLSGGLAGGAGMLLAGSLNATLGLPSVAAIAAVGCTGAGLVLAAHALLHRSRSRSSLSSAPEARSQAEMTSS